MKCQINHHEFECVALTATHAINYNVEISETSPVVFKNLVNKPCFDNLCENGCPNYNKKWSCPPYSPDYCQYIEGKKFIYTFFLRLDLSQMNYIKNDYLKIKAANTILKSRMDKFLQHITNQNDYKYISSGSCRLCKPCNKKRELPCAHPNKMTYSFEALGIDVSKLVNMVFDKPLLWYKKGHLPQYTSIVCGLLTDSQIQLPILQNKYIDLIIR